MPWFLLFFFICSLQFLCWQNHFCRLCPKSYIYSFYENFLVRIYELNKSSSKTLNLVRNKIIRQLEFLISKLVEQKNRLKIKMRFTALSWIMDYRKTIPLLSVLVEYTPVVNFVEKESYRVVLMSPCCIF